MKEKGKGNKRSKRKRKNGSSNIARIRKLNSQMIHMQEPMYDVHRWYGTVAEAVTLLDRVDRDLEVGRVCFTYHLSVLL